MRTISFLWDGVRESRVGTNIFQVAHDIVLTMNAHIQMMSVSPSAVVYTVRTTDGLHTLRFEEH